MAYNGILWPKDIPFYTRGIRMLGELQQFIPLFPLHYTTIINYLLLLGTIVTLGIAGGGADTPLSFIFIMAVMAGLIGTNLYLNYFPNIPRFAIFLGRVSLFAIPLMLTGLSPNEQSRGLGVMLAVIGFPLFVLIFVNPYMPAFLVDPRIPW